MAWRHKTESDQTFDEELQTHLAMLADRFLRQGMSPTEARNAALRQFGNTTLLKEVRREMRASMHWENLWRDLRFGLRGLKRTPGFTTAAVLLLLLGIGANTAIFSVLDALLLRTLPVREPHELTLLHLIPSTKNVQFPLGTVIPREFLGANPGFPYPLYEALRDSNTVFSDLVADFKILPLDFSLRGSSEAPLQVRVDPVSGNYFSTLGLRPMLGRLMTAEDNKVVGSGGPQGPVAVISYRFWQRRFTLDPGVVGRLIQLNGQPFTVVGVSPPRFDGEYVGTPADIWVPIVMLPTLSPGVHLENVGFTLIGRLKPGITRQQAESAMQFFIHQNPGAAAFFQFTLSLFGIDVKDGSQGVSSLRAQFSTVLLIVMSAVGLVLLIACANLATLLLARGAARRREISIRLSIGARRGHVIRQLLTESLLLAWIGWIGGLLLSRWGATLLVGVISGGASDALTVGTDWRILAFAMGIALLSGMLFGLAPALQATHVNLSSALNCPTGGVRAEALPGSTGIRTLVAAQIALSAVLLMGASLFARTSRNLEALDVGFNRDHTLLIDFDLGNSGYRGAKLAELSDDSERRLRALPGVVATAATTGTPFGASLGGSPVQVPGYVLGRDESHFCAYNMVGPDFFQASGIPLLRGREFGPHDNSTSPLGVSNSSLRVAVVNEAFARKYFGGRDPIGQRFTMRKGSPTERQIEIVGVAKDAKYGSLREPTAPLIYLYNAQDVSSWRKLSIVVRFTGSSRYAAPLMAAIREVGRTNAGVRVASLETMKNLVDHSLLEEHMAMDLSTAASGLALLIVCIGVYGTMAYALARRTRELGIRTALGAKQSDIYRMVMRESLTTVFAGLLLGVPAALVVARLIAARFFGVGAVDPLSITATVLLITAVAVAASFVPAWRAGRVDPMVALRYE